MRVKSAEWCGSRAPNPDLDRAREVRRPAPPRARARARARARRPEPPEAAERTLSRHISLKLPGSQFVNKTRTTNAVPARHAARAHIHTREVIYTVHEPAYTSHSQQMVCAVNRCCATSPRDGMALFTKKGNPTTATNCILVVLSSLYSLPVQPTSTAYHMCTVPAPRLASPTLFGGSGSGDSGGGSSDGGARGLRPTRPAAARPAATWAVATREAGDSAGSGSGSGGSGSSVA